MGVIDLAMVSIGLLTVLGLQKVERWTDAPSPSDIRELGTVVALPVTVSCYTTRTGTAVRLAWGARVFWGRKCQGFHPAARNVEHRASSAAPSRQRPIHNHFANG